MGVNNMFNKKDLKSGMMLKYEGGRIKLVLIGTKNGDVTCNITPEKCFYGGFRHFDYFPLSNLNEDLTDNSGISGDVVEVFDMYGQSLFKRSENGGTL